MSCLALEPDLDTPSVPLLMNYFPVETTQGRVYFCLFVYLFNGRVTAVCQVWLDGILLCIHLLVLLLFKFLAEFLS